MSTKQLLVSLVDELPSRVPRETMWPVVGVVVATLALVLRLSQSKSKYPFVNYNGRDWTYIPAKLDFLDNARSLISKGVKKYANRPFQLVTDLGPLIMLPPDYIDAVNREHNLSFNAFTEQQNLSNYETFQNFRSPPDGLFEEAVMKGLTRSLPKFTKALSEQMTKCLEITWGDSTEWHERDARKDVLNWVSRLSARIFNGPELADNEEWLRISIEYTVDNFIGAAICKLIPVPFRWPAERLLPLCRKIRRDRRAGAKILRPILAERRKEVETAEREGRKANVPDDSIEWFRAASKGRAYNDINIQLGLSMAAIHTTSDLVGQATLNLCAHPETVEPLRQEAIEVLSKHGWRKVALTELRLLDSFLKETQRQKPIGMATMHRRAIADVELPNGVTVRKGERLGISSHRMWSEEFYDEPEKFDAYRFLKRRKMAGLEHKSLLVSTSTDHTAFSHGKHACPGRFFAANEVKIALVHILLKYDVKIEDPKMARWIERGVNMLANPEAKMMVRRRKEELDLATLPSDY